MEDDSKLFLSAGFLPMKFSRLFAACCLFFFSGIVVSGEEPEEVTMLIDVVAWGDNITGLHLGDPDSEEGAVHALSFRYGREPVRYSGPPWLAIYRPRGDEQDQEAARPPQVEDVSGKSRHPVPQTLAERRVMEPSLVALVKLPMDARRATVLLSPAGDGTYRGYVINDDPSRLPPGKLLVHNLSPHTIALQFGSNKPAIIEPRGEYLFEDSQKYLPYRLAYQIKYQPEEANHWEIQGSNIMKLSADEQTQMLILRSDNQHFLSSSGARSGYLQKVILRRKTQ